MGLGWKQKLVSLSASVGAAALILSIGLGAGASPAQADGGTLGGGQPGCTAGRGCGTLGYAWADSSDAPVGQITVDHLVGDTGTPMSYSAFKGGSDGAVYALKTTDKADLALMRPIASDLEPLVALRDGTGLTVSGYANEGDIRVGQKVCHSGWSDQAGAVHEICGVIDSVGPAQKCSALLQNPILSTCNVMFRTQNGVSAGGSPDAGAAVYSYNSDGTIDLVGTMTSTDGGSVGSFEPTYAAMQIFGGHPLYQGTSLVNDQGLCADVYKERSADGTPVILWPCGKGKLNQTWMMAPDDTVRALGKCLDADSKSPGSGPGIVLNTCTGSASQKWAKSDGHLLNTSSSLCLATEDWPRDGAQLQLMKCDQSSHTWTWVYQ